MTDGNTNIPIAQVVKFQRFAHLLESIANAHDSLSKKRIFYDFCNKWRDLLEKRKCSQVPLCDDDSAFCFIRLMAPKFDTSRAAYGLARAKLLNLLKKIFNISVIFA